MKTRRLRGKRARTHVPTVLTERDLDVLTLVGLVAYATTEQLARDLFPSADRARRRLRQLLDAGIIRVTLAGSREQNLISLTRQGCDALAAARGRIEGVQLAGVIAVPGIQHHLGVVDMRLYMSALAGAGIGELVAWHGGRTSFAKEIGLAEVKLIPDGIAEVTLGKTNGVVAVEVDNATEGSAFLGAKLERYVSMLEARWVKELWFLACGTDTRIDLVRTLCIDAGIGRWTRIFTKQDVEHRPVVLPARLARSQAAESSS